MKVYWAYDGWKQHEYAPKLIKYLAELAGAVSVGAIAEADIVATNSCDITDLLRVERIKRECVSHSKPLLVGGQAALTRAMQLAADYACLGEGYRVAEMLGSGTDPAELLELPNIATPTRTARIDSVIDFRKTPVFKITDTGWGYYCGKGCPGRCKFCQMSYTSRVEFATEPRIKQVASAIAKRGGKLTPMVAYWPYKWRPGNMTHIDLTIRDYVRNGLSGGKGNSIFRGGIEFCSEENRRKLAKPISMDLIRDLFARTKAEKQRAVIYFIAGIDTQDETLEFISQLPSDLAMTPRLDFHFTYFERQPHTPMGLLDLRQTHAIDKNKIRAELRSRNRRIVMTGPSYRAYSVWRSALQTASTPREVEVAKKLRYVKEFEGAVDILIKHDCGHLLGTKSLDEIRAMPRKLMPGIFVDETEGA